MAYDQPGYELHFHGIGQSAVVSDYKKVAQILHSGLTQPNSVHQFPPDVLDFTGRQAELDSLTNKMLQATGGEGKSSNICVVTGQAGVGKSALAIHAADRLKSDFPDGQIYVNLRRRDNQPIEPFEVLAGFLRAWGVDEYSMPKNLTQRSNLYRSLLSGQRVLVLLDNADDEVQVRPLLPDSPTCAVLITSRKRLATLEGAAILNLAVMTQAESLQLLQKLVGIDRMQAELEAAKNIIELCSQLPLAIRIAGGMLRSKPDEKLRDYAGKLTDERQRLAQLYFSDLDIRANLTLSYHEFDLNTARLFRLLGLLTGSSFASGLAAAMLDCEPQTAQNCVNCLVDRQLLEPISQGRYHFHDLVRLFARGQLAVFEPAQVRQAARIRVYCWYLEMAQKMNLALNPEDCRQLAEILVKGKEESVDAIAQKLRQVALNWFETERTNLLLSVDWANQAQAREIAILLALNLIDFFHTYAYSADWKQIHLLALQASRELDNSTSNVSNASLQTQAQILIKQGNVHSVQSNWEKASECYEQSLGIFGQIKDFQGVAQNLGNLGNVYLKQSQWGKASECYKQSLKIFREQGDCYGEAQTLANMGILYVQQNNLDKGVMLWQEALTKLPSDLPKSKQIAQWLESLNRPIAAATPTPSQPPERSRMLDILGIVVAIAIALFLLVWVLSPK